MKKIIGAMRKGRRKFQHCEFEINKSMMEKFMYRINIFGKVRVTESNNIIEWIIILAMVLICIICFQLVVH